MASALDEVLENKQAQEFWLRRLVAIFIDALIIFIPISLMVTIAWAVGFFGQVSWILSGGLLVAYSALFESELGYTIGKRIMGIEVVSLDPRPYDMKRALIRNITKIHGIFLIIDMLLGLMAEDRVNMRYLDTVVGTEVVDSQVAEWRRAHGFAPPPGDGQAPPVTVQSEETAAEPTMPPEVADTEPEPIAPPEPPSEEVVVEMTPEEDGAPGIAPPAIPPEDELVEVSMDEIMDEGPAEDTPAYKISKKPEGE
ncbi:MAG: RDD family protein [Candidatus Thermoplasmatota archaeon]|nr:RDD family protein [Candidatus Thermoplasmatota archaeon]